MTPMKKYFLMLLLCLPLRLLAWNLEGHALVAEIAYDQLSPVAQAQMDQLANRVFVQLPLADQQFLNRRLPGLSSYARVAALPDTWSDLTIQQLFARFHAPLVMALQPYARDTTAGWHFMDRAYGSKRYCPAAVDDENVVWAIPLLQKALAEARDPNTQALILILLSHYVADIHQPLHVITKENWFCSHDGGGNGFCLKSQRGRCVLSLHKFWDSGLGYLKPRRNLLLAARNLQQKWPESDFTQALQVEAPLAWAQQEFTYANFIYETPKNHKPAAIYLQQGRELAEKQLVLAGYRLGRIIAALGQNR